MDVPQPVTPAQPPSCPPAPGPREEGLMMVELVILTPLLIAVLLVLAGLGVVVRARQLADAASAAAVRAASLSTSPGQATGQAEQAAGDTLTQAGVSCTRLQVDVDTTQFHAGGQVAVTVHCTADLAGLAVAGLPGTVNLTSTSRTPLEQYRQFAGTTP